MKFVIASAALFASLSAHAAQDLIRYTRNEGFSITPGFETVVIQNDGKVRFHSELRNRTTGKTDVQDTLIARLSLERLKALERLANQIHADDLKDQDAGQPMCTDAPSSSIVVVKNNVEFSRHAGCHTYVNNESPAVELRALVEGLVALSQM